MVAAAGEVGALKPSVALGFLGATLAGIAIAAFLSPRAFLHGSVPLEKPPDALVERSKEIARRLGYAGKPAGTAWGISVNTDYRRWVEKNDKGNDRWNDVPTGRPAILYFWYRQSQARLIQERFRGDDFGWWAPSETDPPVNRSGMIGVELDTLGRLIRFAAVPAPLPTSSPAAGQAAPDWAALFSEAGLDMAAFVKTEPRWVPPFFADTREAWIESKPKRPDRPMRVEAAALGGRPVYFELAGPWTRPPGTALPDPSGAQAVGEPFAVGVLLLLIVAGWLIARRNLRLGRGDRRGAMRLAAFLFSSAFIGWALYAHHVAGVAELPIFLAGVGLALFGAALAWILYIALEPILRRRWPDSLIAWTRLLSGRLTDPLVGRVVLAGALLGTFEAILWEAARIADQTLQSPPPARLFVFPMTLLGPRLVASHLFGTIGVSLFSAVANAFLFTLFRAALKKDWLAAAAFVLFWTFVNFLAGGPLLAAAGILVTTGYIVFFLRFGLLVLFVEDYFSHFLQFTLTTDSSAWYAGTSLFLLIVLAAIAVYGFRTATAGQPLLSAARLDD